MFIISRTGATASKLFKNGLNMAAPSPSSDGRPSYNMTIGAMNTAGTMGQWSARQFSFAFISRGLSVDEQLIIKNTVSEYLDSFYMTANILYSGSSTMANYGGVTAISGLVNTLGIETVIAAAGSAIANQVTSYNALTSAVKANIDKAFVMIGGNDMEPGSTAASKITELRNYLSAIKAGSPRCKIYLGTLHPCKQRWIDLYGATDGLVSQQKWVDYNNAIRGLGATPVTEADYYFDQHTTDLDDGAGNLKAIYDQGDHIHMTDAGKAFIVNAFNSKIITVG
jgi:lysophospholipase L1-like esterase